MSASTSVAHDIEKGAGCTHDHHHIERVPTIAITPEMFEKLYLTPQNKVKGDLRSTFGNPTPIALIGLLVSLTPLSCALLGWKDANQSALIGVLIFWGGLMMMVGGILEFFIGNTFPCVVFMSLGALFFSLGATNIPAFGVMQSFVTAEYTSGAQNPVFYSSFAFFLACVGFEFFIFMVAAIRTNLVLITIFLFTVLGLELLAGAYWSIGAGKAELAVRLTHAAGGATFVVDMLGWYLFMVLVLASVDFPFDLPVGDLSKYIKAGSERRKLREQQHTV